MMNPCNDDQIPLPTSEFFTDIDEILKKKDDSKTMLEDEANNEDSFLHQ